MYDVIIVGAGCAGAATALLLGRRGHRVLLVDGATAAPEGRQALLLHRQGPRRLAHWGLVPRLAAAGAPPILSLVEDLGDGALGGRDLMVHGVAFAYGPRRAALQATLVDAAIGAGVELRQGFTVDEYVIDGGRVTGIRGRTAGRPAVAERATLTIGADGGHSALAHATGAAQLDHAPPRTCWYLSHWSGVAESGLTEIVRDRHAILAYPTHEQLTAVLVGWPAEEFPSVRADIEGAFWAALRRAPELEPRLRAGRREEGWHGAAELPSFSRMPWGNGWALVGDAGCHRDPAFAAGAGEALRDAELLAEAVDAGLFGLLPMPEALDGYHRRRDEADRLDREEHRWAARVGSLDDHALRLRAALREHPDEANRYFMASSDMIARDRFFEPDTLGRLVPSLARAG